MTEASAAELPPTDPEPKLARDMTPDQRRAALESIKRGQPPGPMPIDRTALEMTEIERREWLAEHIRRSR